MDAKTIEELREDNRRKGALLIDRHTANALLDLATASLAREGEVALCDALMAQSALAQDDENEPLANLLSNTATRIRALTAENEALRRERDEARESLHLANGTADLAIKHRDAAEKEAAIQKALAVEMAQALDAANADINRLRHPRQAQRARRE